MNAAPEPNAAPAPEPPISLNAHALAYWSKHYRRLEAAKVLTEADVDSFALLCLVWGKILELQALPASDWDFRTPISLDRLLKQYERFATQFALLPKARRAAKMDLSPPKRKNEFGL